MKHLRQAVQFITVLPAGKTAGFDPVAMVAWFPAVGFLLGGILALIDALALGLWGAAAAAVIDVVALAAMTGAFHLDGLGDTADGLFSHRSRERTLEIMKDSRIGAMGVVAIVSVLALKWAGISGLGSSRALLLVLVPAYGRCAILLAMSCLDYGRPEGGTGRPFFERRPSFERRIDTRQFWGVALTLGVSLVLGRRALFLIAGFILLTLAVICYYKYRLGCVTGDMLGAITEVTEAGLFLAAAAGGAA
jgi:adenosylcobinamide-GDP ribazoletransferase